MTIPTWKYSNITVNCHVKRDRVFDLIAGTRSYWKHTTEEYSLTRTSTKAVVEEVKKFGANVSAEVETSLTSQNSFPINPVQYLYGGASSKVGFESSLISSTRVVNTYHGDTEESFKSTEHKVYTAMGGQDTVVYVEKMIFGGLEIRRTILNARKSDWNRMPKSVSFVMSLNVPVEYCWYHIRTAGGLNLAIPENDARKYFGRSLIAYVPTNEAGQEWRWDGEHIVSKQEGGNTFYVAVSENNPRQAAEVILWTKLGHEMGQKWRQEGSHLKNGHGHYLAVSQNGGSNTPLIVYGRTDEDGQKWTFIPSN